MEKEESHALEMGKEATKTHEAKAETKSRRIVVLVLINHRQRNCQFIVQ